MHINPKGIKETKTYNFLFSLLKPNNYIRKSFNVGLYIEILKKVVINNTPIIILCITSTNLLFPSYAFLKKNISVMYLDPKLKYPQTAIKINKIH